MLNRNAILIIYAFDEYLENKMLIFYMIRKYQNKIN